MLFHPYAAKMTMTFSPFPLLSIIEKNKIKKSNANRFPGYNPSQMQ